MATVPTPRTWAVGELLTAAKLNTDLRDGLNFLLAPPLAIMTGPATNIPNMTTTPLPWTVETIDRDGGHSTVTNNTRYTAQTAGYYEIRGAVAWDSGTNNRRWLDIRKGGGTVLASSIFDQTAVTGPSAPVVPTQETSLRALLAVGEYVELTVLHDDGFAIWITGAVSGLPRLELQWISKP